MNLFGNWPAMASTGEAVLFACVAVFMIACAFGILLFKKAAYAAICMVGVMLGLAVLYVTMDAPFLGTVQVIVYTGAIMMLFLFVIMMIGLGASDEYTRQGRARVISSILAGLGLVIILGGAIAQANVVAAPAPAVDPFSNTPITILAAELFSKHWFSMQLAAALLITAAIGAMLLTHTDELGPKVDQRSTAEAKMRAFKAKGRHIGQLPSPGVYATSTAVDVPALSGETLGPVEESVPRVLRVRGLERSVGMVEPEVAQSLLLARTGDSSQSPFGPGAAGTAERSGAWGMPGPAAPTGLNQPLAPEVPAAAASSEEAEATATTTEGAEK